nr:MAG TPA: hypothetical protein [Caudoviricetes sp.]
MTVGSIRRLLTELRRLLMKQVKNGSFQRCMSETT